MILCNNTILLCKLVYHIMCQITCNKQVKKSVQIYNFVSSFHKDPGSINFYNETIFLWLKVILCSIKNQIIKNGKI